MKYIFIINSIAGRGKYKKLLPNIENACKQRNMVYEIRYITEEKNGFEIAKEYSKEENVIYVVGGDGTVTKTLAGIVGTKNKLGIIPAGSGNDTYRTIKNLSKIIWALVCMGQIVSMRFGKKLVLRFLTINYQHQLEG